MYMFQLSMLQSFGELVQLQNHTSWSMLITAFSKTSAKWKSASQFDLVAKQAILRCMTSEQSGLYRLLFHTWNISHIILNILFHKSKLAFGSLLSLFPDTPLFFHLSIRYNVDGSMEFKLLHSDNWQPFTSPSLRKACVSVAPLYTSPQKIKALKFKHLQELKHVLPKDFHPFYDALDHEWWSAQIAQTITYTPLLNIIYLFIYW